MLPRRFSAIFGALGPTSTSTSTAKSSAAASLQPTVKVSTDREVYRPGDQILITIEISNPSSRNAADENDTPYSLLIERLGFEIKGIEKLDPQWFGTLKPASGSKQRRGEYVFMEAATPALVTNQIVSPASTKSYVVRAVLPSIIPPSYKGATIRYMFYVRATMSGQWLILENAHSRGESVQKIPEMETRTPFQVWVMQKASGLDREEGQSDGIVPLSTMQIDMYWKEMVGDSEWVKANDTYDGIEDGYDSSRDDISSVSSYNPMKEHINRTFGSSLSLQSARSLNKDTYLEGERTSVSSNLAIPLLSAAEVTHDNGADIHSPRNLSDTGSPSKPEKLKKSLSLEDEGRASTSPAAGAAETLTSEGFVRGRSYNIRMDDTVLLRFSPKNSDSNYFFSDMIGGTLTFFHEEGARRCLEVYITLETSETISRRYVHPSRKNSPTITKVQSDHYEVVADLVQTSFLFSIPMDGPMSFSTPHVSVKWVLRFEFFTTPKNVDWTRYDHPLLVEGREKSEWVLPIVVHAPPGVGPSGQSRNTKSILGTVVGS